MEAVKVTNIVGVRFSKVGKIYHFDASDFVEVKNGDAVVVETARGWQLGEIAQLVDAETAGIEGSIKPIARMATPRDLLLRKLWQVRELDVVETARKRAEELRLTAVKIVQAEYSFDGARLSILYSSEGDEKVDLKSLRQDMQKIYAPSQVELHQIGPRDVAKIMGGMGACGLETRCCSAFLTDFNSISIRMAKEQGISLSPTEITGMCGRLRCCLIYEYQTYIELRKELPKRGKQIMTPLGEGKVIDVSPLSGKVRVDIPETGIREFTTEELAQTVMGDRKTAEIGRTGDESSIRMKQSEQEMGREAKKLLDDQSKTTIRGEERHGKRRRGGRRN